MKGPLDPTQILIEARKRFPAAGLVSIQKVSEELARWHQDFDRWVAAGHAGTMQYLVRGLDRRGDPEKLLPGAQSVLVVLERYDSRPLEMPIGANPSDGTAKFARYLRGPRSDYADYHHTLKGSLAALASDCGLGCDEHKVCVDTSAVQERSWAAAAGLGWIGKNQMLIHPQLGSYTFIGVLLLTLPCDIGPVLHPDYCGDCRRCLDACPTGALIPDPSSRREYILDARACLSYQTLEHRGPAPTQEFSEWVAGCDVCQEVCPFNTKTVRADEQRAAPPSAPFSPQSAENAERYRKETRGTAIDRIKFEDFVRNLQRLRPSRKP